MAVCYHRKLAYLTEPTDLFEKPRLVFKEPKGSYRKVTIPCGKCVACRVNNAASWATRCSHEAEYVSEGCFVTLTYNPENCPRDYQLVKSDFQKFMKRLRFHVGASVIRAFFAVGEYGEKFGRPHYHAVILGWSPKDLVFHSYSYSGYPIYTSKTLEQIWGKGFCPVGTMTSASAAYVARYSKKVSAPNHGKRTPPFFLASRNIPLSNGKKGALGAQWVLDNHEALRFGSVSHPSKPEIRVRIPDYYFDLLEKWFPAEYERIKKLRYDYAMEAMGGMYIVDDHGEPSVYLPDADGLTEEDLKELRDFCGADETENDLSRLLHACAEVVRAKDNAQLEALSKLKRNME